MYLRVHLVCVSTEVMLARQEYTKSIDVWAVGCIFAELLGKYERARGLHGMYLRGRVRSFQNVYEVDVMHVQIDDAGYGIDLCRNMNSNTFYMVI